MLLKINTKKILLYYKMTYDIIIIGAGIAGLYSAYKITKQSPETNLILLESNEKKYIGGRMGETTFEGMPIVTGAGIGRKKKDELLIQLLKELKVPYSEFESRHHYADTINPECEVKETFIQLKKVYRENPIKASFKEFATQVLGVEKYTNLVVCSGYRDYENEDVYDTLYHYGFDDNYGHWTGLGISWKALKDALVEKIGIDKIKTGQKVNKINKRSHNEYELHTEIKMFSTQKIIMATTIESVMNLLPNHHKLYKQIKGQPFVRVYGKFSKECIPLIQEYTKSYIVVPGPLQKIIRMSSEKGIYMIAYSDNKYALYLKKYLENTPENRAKFCRLLEIALSIPKGSLELTKILGIYWDIGTHYYTPLDNNEYKNRKQFIEKAQYPEEGITVVGEMVSMNQGWIEGALESVERILR
jgi:hypothetical protein